MLMQLPTFNSIVTGSQDMAQGLFEQLLPMLYVAVGVTVAVVLIILFTRTIKISILWLFNMLTGKTSQPHHMAFEEHDVKFYD